MKMIKPTRLILTTILGGTIITASTLMAAGNKADRNGDGILTKAENSVATSARFAKIDVNSDGVINADDRAARANERFAKMDANNDGSVSQSEFNAAREARKAEREQKREERKAAKAERKGKGPKGRRGGKGRKGARAMLKKADTNGDKMITLAEFTAFSDTRFAKMDADNDGQVTKEERRAARKGRRGKGRGQRGQRPNAG